MKPPSAKENDVAPREPAAERARHSGSRSEIRSEIRSGTRSETHSASRPENFEVFEYPVDGSAQQSPDWSAFGGSQDQSQPDMLSSAEFEERLAEETRRAFDQGRERGHQEGRQAEREAQRESVAATLRAAQENQVRQLAGLVESFASARDRYLHQVEHEVVKLALAIAARILRREAQMDPLLLTGAARVALGQLAATTEVRLRVPAGDANLWAEAMALLPNLPLKPAVVAVDTMRLGDCLIETSLGTVDLGIRAQLAEIERGFFDRAGTPASPQTLDAPDRITERIVGQPERRS
jgi:flagellar assembly protein FliH